MTYKEIFLDIPWCMLFADDVVLIDESRIEVNQKLKLWRQTLESKGFRLRRIKTEYMRCQFSGGNSDDGDASLDERIISMNETFQYSGSMLQSDREIDENISHRIRAGWVKIETNIWCSL
jgi:hypothetical protein